MPFWRKLDGLVIINDVPDDEENGVQQIPVRHSREPKVTKKKEKKVKKDRFPPPKDETPLEVKTNGVSCIGSLLCSRTCQLALVLLLCLFLGLLLPFILTSTVLAPPSGVSSNRGYCFINQTIMYSCLGGNVTESACTSNNCCYQPSNDINVPWCYHSVPSEYGYEVVNATSTPLISSYTRRIVQDNEIIRKTVNKSIYRLGNDVRLSVNLKNLQAKTPYGDDMRPAQLVAERSGDDIVRLTISSPGRDEGTLQKDPTFSPSKANSPKLEVEITEESEWAFNVTVSRISENPQVLFSTIFGPLIVGDGYMELTTTLPSAKVYGLGDRFTTVNNPRFDKFESWSLNSRDYFSSYSNQSTYSSTHPFYMCMEPKTSLFHGVYIRTSAPLQIATVPAPGISFRTNMGSFKVLVMAGPTPKDVSQQFTGMVGRPPLPPFWAFGFHLCRTVIAEMQESAFNLVSAEMAAANLPYDSDCLDARLTYPDSYAPVPDWAEAAAAQLHNASRKVLGVTYPYLVNGSTAYLEAENVDVLMKLANSTQYFGLISQSAVGYPDYLNENSFKEWLDLSATVKDRFNGTDGVMLLHGSPANEADTNNITDNVMNLTCSAAHPQLCCSPTAYNFSVDVSGGEVSDGTLCWATIHESLGGARHLAHHNAYSTYYTKRIRDVLQSIRPSNRPLVLSTATHPESGGYGGQVWEGIGGSIAEQRRGLHQVLEAGLYGIPLAGAPPCGSRNDTNDANSGSWEEACLRSYQMSIFYPLLLSHYELDQRSINLTDARQSFEKQIRPYLLLRYTLLPTLYTLAEEASRFGTPIVRGLYYEFPDDAGSLDIADQFMVGSSLLVVPNLLNSSDDTTPDIAADVIAYMPPGCWYNLLSGHQVSCSSVGTNVTLPTLLTDVNVFLKGGKAIFLQGDLRENIRHSEDSRAQNFTLVAAAKNGTTTKGVMYYDDGVTPSDAAGYRATFVNSTLSAQNRVLEVFRRPVTDESVHYCDDKYSSLLQAVIVMGLEQGVKNVTHDGAAHEAVSQDKTTGTLYITGVNFDWCSKSATNFTWSY